MLVARAPFAWGANENAKALYCQRQRTAHQRCAARWLSESLSIGSSAEREFVFSASQLS